MAELALMLAKQIIIGFFFICLFIGWGAIFLKLIIKEFQFDNFLQQLFIKGVIGISFCIFYLAALSSVGIMYKYLLLFLLIGLYGLKFIRVTKMNLLHLACIFMLTLPVMFLTLYPPMRWDDLSFHLPIAQSIIDTHKLSFNSYIRYPVFPSNGELLLTLGLAINENVAQLMPWICMFFISMGSMSFMLYKVRMRSTYLFLILFLSSSMVIYMSAVSYIDIILALYVTAAIYFFELFRRKQQQGWIWFAGMALGIAVGIKYSALIFCLILGFYLLIRKQWKPFTWLTAITCLVSLPWFIRNIYFTANPVWPFLSSIFGESDIWSTQDYQGQFADFEASGVPKTLMNFIRLPLYLSSSHEGGLSIAIWFGLLIFLLFYKKKEADWLLLIVFGCFTLSWFFSINLVRYFLPIVPVMIIMSALGYDYFFKQLNDKKLKLSFIGLIFIFGLFMESKIIKEKVSALPLPSLNSELKYNYLAGILPTYKATRLAASSDGLTYGLLNENMHYYGEGKVVGDWFGPFRYSHLLSHLGNPDIIYKYLKDSKISNLLISKSRLNEDQLKELKLDSRFILKYEDNFASLYQLK